MKYVVVSHHINIENERVKTYAIIVLKRFIPIKIMRDVSTDGQALQKLVKRLNKGKVELVHLEGILEDYYNDYF